MTAAEQLLAQRAAQGYPDTIEDPAALARLAALLHGRGSAPGGGSGGRAGERHAPEGNGRRCHG